MQGTGLAELRSAIEGCLSISEYRGAFASV